MQLSSSHFNLNKPASIPNVLSVTFQDLLYTSERNFFEMAPISCLKCPTIFNWSQPTNSGTWTCLFCGTLNKIKEANVLPPKSSNNETFFVLENAPNDSRSTRTKSRSKTMKYMIFCTDISESMNTTLSVI